MNTDVSEVIRSAKDNGMVPFVIVIPVSPHLLAEDARDAGGSVADMLAREASDAMHKVVGEYYAAHRP